MKPAKTSKRHFENTKLLVFSEQNQVVHSQLRHLEDFLQKGDLVVVNRSATLPSSFRGYVESKDHGHTLTSPTKKSARKPEEAFVEIRLASFLGPSPDDLSLWRAIAFGPGDWTQPTEDRPMPPQIKPGSIISISETLKIEILEVYKERLLKLRFHSNHLQRDLYRHGQPIQYSHLKEKLEVWDQQTLFSGPPISVEPPSASFAFNWQTVLGLKRKGINFAPVLHSAGISSTGDDQLDLLLPLEEWYEIPNETAERVNRAKEDGRKILALGTSALRAMESSWSEGRLLPGKGLSQLKITPEYQIQSATSLISGMHEVGTSHMKILKSFCPYRLVRDGYTQAASMDYRGHEYGDISLLDCGSLTGPLSRSNEKGSED